MVDRIEELLKIKVYGIAVSLPYVFLDFPYRVMGGPVWSESITVLRKVGVEDRGQYLGDRLLNDAIKDRRDTQWTSSSTVLGNLHPLDRRGRIGPLQKSGFDSFPVLVGILRELLNRYTIDTGHPFVCLHLFPRLIQVL
ncbi:MAG: hypothetical protein A4E62_02689 [Syntrophorhabdus sp. PtaU1.Bin002]|nr:MAG: hypothetical protein A4E62_02689 [Syntrophorhabdus sp. PtaU1.Bin002]